MARPQNLLEVFDIAINNVLTFFENRAHALYTALFGAAKDPLTSWRARTALP
jgi:hypothetical protein